MQIACSKPYVEAVAWQDLVDYQQIELPMSGLVDEEMQAKPAWKRLVNFRRHLIGVNQNATEQAAKPVVPTAGFAPPAEKNPED